ncbi:MAG TPA: MupA/Atu3671 family FMN-dependent luciferase-like monooxygenase [Polyangiales bacterium]|nr:MupA/Atu3671 family FMN-dependent luciferase-like monooxygenase [Polyangiales bacterium]
MTQTQLRCVLIGSDSLLIECGETWLSRGHHIQAVVTDTSRISNWAAQRGIRVVAADSDYVAALSQLSFDYLFAITFLRVIPKAVLALPKRAAINFHDGPLPHYAGLNAPSWALINQEREYGITWHVMTERLDGGEVLKQVSFEINDDETSLSLNTRCFGLAIESFSTLIDELAQGTEKRQPQQPPSDAKRAYFGRYARPAAATLLDFSEPAEKLVALLRALDFGPRYPNTLGAASIIAGDRAFVVTSAEASLEDSSAAPGSIVGAGGDSFSVACGQGTLIIRGLRDSTDAPIAMHEALSQLRCEVGSQLTQLSAADRSALSELDAKLAKSERFWVERLATLDPSEPPYASGVPLASLGAFAELVVNVPEQFRAQFSAQLDGALAAAFACYIGRLAGTPQVAIALSDAKLASVPPAFAPLLAASAPLSIETEPAPRFTDVIAQLEAAREDAHKRGGFLRNVAVRYPELADSAAARDPGLLPVGIALDVDAVAGSVLQLQIKSGSAWLRYESSRLNELAAARIATELAGYMLNLAHAADRPVEQVEVLSEKARQQILGDWNNTGKAPTAVRCLHQAIEEQVDRTPDAVAVVCEDRSLTFRELDFAANSVARRLLTLGLTFDKPVGVYCERSLDLVIAALGVLKAGGAYVPLDPAYPADRIAFMLDDAHLDVVVTQTALSQRLPKSNVRSVLVDAPETLSSKEPRPDVGVEPANLAYLIYTSGSTGKPKGVMVEHRQVSNFFVGMDERIEQDAARTFLAVTSLSFDISVLELWWTLSRGFKVVVHADRARATAQQSRAAAGGGRPLQFSLFYFSADAQASGGARYKLLLEGAKFADTHGFSAVWTPERHFHAFGGLYPNPAVTGAAVAAITQNVEIRAGSVVLPLHHPARVAEQWAVVDNISNGRVGVSFASGWQPDDFVLMPENYKDAKGIMMRNIEVVRKLWRGETISFEGPQGPVAVRTLPEPVQKELPVWITTAGNAETFEMAGKAGANLLTHLLGQSLEKLAPKIAAYRKARAAAGFDPETGIVSLMLHTFVGEDRDQVKDTVRAPLKAYLATSMDLIKDKASVFPAFAKPKGTTSADLDQGFATLTDEDRDALLEGAFERYFEQSGLFGTVEDALAMVEKVRAVGVDDVACLIDFGAQTDLVFQHLPYLDKVRAAAISLNAAPQPAAAHEVAEVADTGEHPFLRDVRAHSVTHMQCTPSMMRMLLDHSESRSGVAALKHVMLGGEALAPDLLQDLRKVTQATITNMYGPTETTVWSSTHRVSPEDKTVPIGKAIVNTTFYVTDKRGRLLPANVDGELWIGGQGVTRGYFERPELTAERFVRDPFSNDDGARMYSTGDRARFRADGVLEFLGRADFQVKLRGYRIELGEIESRARSAPGIKDAVVIVREDRPGDQRLVAYLVPADASQVSKLDTEPVRELLRSQLPDYMVPVAFVVLAELPLTPNRKTDRKALPAPQLQAAAAEHKEAPQSETDQAIAGVWRDVLGRDEVGLDDNFFDLGGHSLLVVRAHRQLQEALGRTLALTDLYRFPTIRKFSTFLTEGASGDTKKAGARGAKRREAMRRRVG